MSTHTKKSEAETTAQAFTDGRLTDPIGGPPRVSVTFQVENETDPDAGILSSSVGCPHARFSLFYSRAAALLTSARPAK